MGRTPCCEKIGLKKGLWTPEEDQKLVAYIEENGYGGWRALPSKAGLQRCGKSCRLRWTNYLRPDIKRGKFNSHEEQTIIQLHALLGNRWSTIATHLPMRTDNEIKNHWNTHLKKRLTKMGIDPVTHKPMTHPITSGSSSDSSSSANTISHMAQWESARLETEARSAHRFIVQKSGASRQLEALEPVTPSVSALGSASSSLSAKLLNKVATQPAAHAVCLDVLRAWKGTKPESITSGSNLGFGSNYHSLESPTSTSSFSQNSNSNPGGTQLIRNLSFDFDGVRNQKGLEVHDEYWDGYEKCLTDFTIEDEDHWKFEPLEAPEQEQPGLNFGDGFANILLSHFDNTSLLNDSAIGASEADGSEDGKKNVFNFLSTSV